MQFPPEAVREIARMLQQSDLGEISFEAQRGARLTLKRTPKLLTLAPAAAANDAEPSAATLQSTLESAPAEVAVPAAVIVAAPCVGVFHAAKDAVEVGSVTRRKQLLGVVESLKVPNEIYATAAGVVAQIWVGDGQGVEWGQPLFEIQPALEKDEG